MKDFSSTSTNFIKSGFFPFSALSRMYLKFKEGYRINNDYKKNKLEKNSSKVLMNSIFGVLKLFMLFNKMLSK